MYYIEVLLDNNNWYPIESFNSLTDAYDFYEHYYLTHTYEDVRIVKCIHTKVILTSTLHEEDTDVL